MGFFKDQFSSVVEWDEFRDDMIFWKWGDDEIKKGSRLIIDPGQDAIFFQQGRIEGIFQKPGSYDIDSEIIPFLSTLKGFKFGFHTGMRVKVLFVNTKEFTIKWGTKGPINIPAPQLPGGMPIRANGTLSFKVEDYVALIDKVAGVKDSYLTKDIRLRIISVLNQLLMKWIVREGKDMFNLQTNADEISNGIKEDLDMEIIKLGMTITDFRVMDFNYPEEIQDMIKKAASQGMIGDVDRYQRVEMTDAMASGKFNSAGGTASDMAGMMMGMNVANQMMNNMNMNTNQQNNQNQGQNQGQTQSPQQSQQTPQENSSDANSTGKKPNFCPNCGQKNEGANFCANCGQKLG